MIAVLSILSKLSLAMLLDATAVSQAQPATGRWEVQKSGIEDDLKAVHFVDDNTGIAVGTAKTILKTTDGGKTWRRVLERDPRGPTFDTIFFSGPKEGWTMTGILGTILHTKDGGDTWTQVPLPDPQSAGKAFCKQAGLGSSYFLQHSVFLYRTDDGGKSWVEISKACPTDSQNSGELWFTDAMHGCMAWSGDQFATSADGGKTWKTGSAKEASGGFARLQFLDAKTGWMLPTYGKIHFTSDGGNTWQAQEIGHPPSRPLVGMQFTDAKVGHVLTGATASEAFIHRTIDGGKTWNVLVPVNDAPSYVRGLSFPNSRNGWVVGDRGYIGRYEEAGKK